MSASTAVAYRWNSNVESMEMEGEWVILHADNNTITKLRDTGGWVWSRLQDPVTLGELVMLMQEEFDVNDEQAGRDIQCFIDQLLNLQLVDIVQ